MTSSASLLSPRLALLQQDLISGDGAALARFWQSITTQGTPLIEGIPGDNTQMLVTFLWRAHEETRNVIVVVGVTPYWDFTRNLMARLLDTDLWYKTERVPADVRVWYRFSPNDSLEPLGTGQSEWDRRTGAFQPDPYNPRHYIVRAGPDNPFSQLTETWSVLELPATPPQPWVQPQPHVPSGQIQVHRVPSAILGDERTVWVYTPPGYTADGEPFALLLLFDGSIYTDVIPTPTILDNLYATGQLPPMVALMVSNPSLEARLHELLGSLPFLAFVTQELLPWVHHHYHVTVDPAQTIVGGSSAGGFAAAFAGLHHPELFGNILSQSGAFWWKPPDDPEFEWLIRQFAAAPVGQRLQVYLDVGSLESEPQRRANEHLRDQLRAQGHAVHYAEFSGGHTFLCWQGTLSDGLLALLGRDSTQR